MIIDIFSSSALETIQLTATSTSDVNLSRLGSGARGEETWSETRTLWDSKLKATQQTNSFFPSMADDGFPVVSAFLAATTVGLLLLTLTSTYKIKARHRQCNYPPRPGRLLPLIGHVPFLRPTPLQAFSKWRKEYGDVFSFYIGSKLYVILNSYDSLREAVVKKADSFSDRPMSFYRRLNEMNEQGKLLGLGGPHWKEHRAVSIAILKSFGMGKSYLADRISKQVETYMSALSAFGGKAQDVKVLTNAAVANVICAMLLGQGFDYKDQVFISLIELVSEKLRLMKSTAILNVFPWMVHLPGDLTGGQRLQQISGRLKKYFSNHFIDKFKNNLAADDNDNFIKAYLREAAKRKQEGVDTDLDAESLVSLLIILFIAGTETSSTTILWAMAYAVNFPTMQDKIYRELKEVVGTDRKPSMDDKPRLNYLNAFITETQRLGSVAPISAPHVCSQTATVGGYTVPEGATVLLNIDAIMKDECLWEQPLQFRPERFLDQHGQLSISEKFVPFSMGRRVCLGQALAQMELFLFISCLFQRFEILPEHSNSPPSMEPVLAMTHIPKPFKVRFVERS